MNLENLKKAEEIRVQIEELEKNYQSRTNTT